MLLHHARMDDLSARMETNETLDVPDLGAAPISPTAAYPVRLVLDRHPSAPHDRSLRHWRPLRTKPHHSFGTCIRASHDDLPFDDTVRKGYVASGVDPDVREGYVASVRLNTDEPRIRIFALFPAAEFLVRVRGVGGELRRRLPIEQHLIGPIRHRDLVGVPSARRETLV